MAKIHDVEQYIQSHGKWATLLNRLRDIILSCDLMETIKWGAPVYTFEGKNIVGLGAFKSYAGLWFFNGALLKDKQQVLMNAQEGKTRAMRQWRFANENKIETKLVKSYLNEAIQLQREGKSVTRAKPSTVLQIPKELAEVFATDKELALLFADFTAYKQKEFIEHISSAKQDKTRVRRLEKCLPLIRQGVGLHDKYRDCYARLSASLALFCEIKRLHLMKNN